MPPNDRAVAPKDRVQISVMPTRACARETAETDVGADPTRTLERRALALAQRALAVLSLSVVPNVRSGSTPCVLTAFTAVVRHRQGASAREHNRRQN